MTDAFGLYFFLLVIAVVGPACQTVAHPTDAANRPFSFRDDTFSFANELVWEYEMNSATGQMRSHKRTPRPDYTLHCFVMARAARQFFYHAAFDPNLPKMQDVEYAPLIRRVLHRHGGPKVVIPGYANLHKFSREKGPLLKRTCGGAWHSYFQRGNWRMVFPFRRRQQLRVAERLEIDLDRARLPIVHVVRFPELTINHAILLFDRTERDGKFIFSGYDPNSPAAPIQLSFDPHTRQFVFPATRYFSGGAVDVYEIYRAWNY